MMYHRQKVLIALLNALGGEAASTDFQKLLFLFTREEIAPSYDFVPYKFGCFSFTSYADKRKLMERGLLAEDEKMWRLASDSATADPELLRRARHFVLRYPQRGRELIRLVYESHPLTAWRSEIAEKVITEEATMARIQSARPPQRPPGLVTIGYEGRSLELYLDSLLRDGVTVLCDVRRNPLSRKYGFSKGALSSACEHLGISYAHLPELGIASDRRRELTSQSDYDELFGEYEARDLPKQGHSVEKITNMIREGERVALTCYELLPQQCHRHCVAKAVEARMKKERLATLHM
jgi:hypothetical protein